MAGGEHRELEKEWHDFERQPKSRETLGFPSIPNKSLTTSYERGILSDRQSTCRLVTVTDCCDGIWRPQWWYFQQEMDRSRAHYIKSFREQNRADPFEDPVVEHIDNFKAPMEAASTIAVPAANGRGERYLIFRCVLTLAPNSLLGFVATLITTPGRIKKTRWTRPYKVYCIGRLEYPETLEEDTKRFINTAILAVPWTPSIRLQTRSGFCEHYTRETSGTAIHERRKTPDHLHDGMHKRPNSLIDPYDPTVIQDDRRQKPFSGTGPEVASIISRIEIGVGEIGCLDIPNSLLATAAAAGKDIEPAVRLNTFRSSEVDADLILKDLDERNIDPDDWDVHPDSAWKAEHPGFFFSFDNVPQSVDYTASGKPAGMYASPHLVLRSFPSQFSSSIIQSLPSDEERTKVRDIDWDALFKVTGTAGGTKVTACATVPADSASLTYDLMLMGRGDSTSRITNNEDGAVLDWLWP